MVPSLPERVNRPEWSHETGWDQVPKHILRLNTDTEFYGIGETRQEVPIEFKTQEAWDQILGPNSRNQAFAHG